VTVVAFRVHLHIEVVEASAYLIGAKYIRFLEVVGLRPADNGLDILWFPFVLGEHKVECFTPIRQYVLFKKCLGVISKD